MPWNDNNDNSGGPWGSGSGNNDGKSPWGRPQGGGAQGPDLEDQLKKMQERFKGGFGGRGGGNGKGGGGFGPLGFVVIAMVAGLAWLSTGVVIVDAGEQAAVFRFGKWETNLGAGFHVHLPVPLERHEIVQVESQQQVNIGFQESARGNISNVTNESLMLTGDENIVDIHFSVFWKVRTDRPQDFLLNVVEPQVAVKGVAESVMREVVGKRELEPIITTERDAVQMEVMAQMQAVLDEYQAGIDILDVQLSKVDPPEQVIDAFRDVVNAGQDATTTINQAQREANRIIPEARGTAQQILQQAEAYREQVVADATGQAARFDQIYAEYRKAPRVTRERMFLETMESVLSRSDKILLDSESGAIPYLPLDQINRRQGNQ